MMDPGIVHWLPLPLHGFIPHETWRFKFISIARHVASIARSGIRDFFDLVQGQPDVISLGVGEPDFVTPWNIREAAIYSLEKGHTSYTSTWGSRV